MLAKDIPNYPPYSTGILSLDGALGGGFPAGSIAVIWGNEYTGKTSIALSIIAEGQKRGKTAIFINTSTSLPTEAMHMIGVDLDKLIVIDAAENGEASLESVIKVLYDEEKQCARLNEGEPIADIIVIDDMTFLLPSTEFAAIQEDGMDKNTLALQARMTSRFFRVIAGGGLLRHGGILVLISQIRMDPGAYGNPERMTGGAAPRFGARSIVKLRKESITAGATKALIGHTVKFALQKRMNHIHGNPMEGEYTVLYGKGVDQSEELVALGLANGLIEKVSQAEFLYTNSKGQNLKIQKIANVRQYFQVNFEEQAFIKSKLEPLMATPIPEQEENLKTNKKRKEE